MEQDEVCGYQGLPTALLQAGEIASISAERMIPLELVHVYPEKERPDHYVVSYLHPTTRKLVEQPLYMMLPNEKRWECYLNWLTEGQARAMKRAVPWRRWFHSAFSKQK